MAEQINTAIDTEPNFNPKQVLNIIEKSKNNDLEKETQIVSKSKQNQKQKQKQKQNMILPSSTTIEKTQYPNPIYKEEPNYLDDQYQSSSKVPNYLNSNSNSNPNSKQKKNKCNGSKCTYKCDSSYSNAITYLDSELKPFESFGNIYDNYAQF